METKLIDYKDMSLAVKALKEGEVIAFPTETVFGLGVISTSKEAFDELVKVKQRAPGKPFTMMCANLSMVARYAEIDAGSVSVMKAFLPGELTILLKAKKGVPEWVTLGTDTIGIRVSNDKNLCALIEEVGVPLLVPSANTANDAPETTENGVFEKFNGQIALILKGECHSKTPSTVVDLRSNKPLLVRQGVITIDEITKAYNEPPMKIVVGSDHGGFNAKETVKNHLLERGFEVCDVGTHSTSSCDYPDFSYALADKIINGFDLGVIVCTSGEGVCIAANRDRRIRCGIGYDDVATGKMREHNNANVVAFGEKYMPIEDILRRVDIFLCEKFSDEEKHHRRVNKL